MKILIVAKDYPPTVGGVENYSQSLAEGLSATHTCNVLTFSSRNTNSSIGDGVEVFRIKQVLKNENAKAFQLFVVAIWKCIMFSTDLVFATTWKVAVPFAILKVFFPFKLMVTIHGAELTRHRKNKFIVKMMRFALEKSDKIISVSDYTKRKALQYNPNLVPAKIEVVYNGIKSKNIDKIDTYKAREELNLSDKDFILTTISRIDERKGHDVVIESLPALIKENNNIKYLIVGDGPRRKFLEELAVNCGVENHVIFEGFVDTDKLKLYYSCCDLFILLNKALRDEDFEGFGLVFVEASLYGKTVVGGDNGGPREVVSHKETGYLIEPDSQTFVNLLQKEIKFDSNLLDEIGQKAKHRASKDFSHEKMIKGVNQCLVDIKNV